MDNDINKEETDLRYNDKFRQHSRLYLNEDKFCPSFDRTWKSAICIECKQTDWSRGICGLNKKKCSQAYYQELIQHFISGMYKQFDEKDF